MKQDNFWSVLKHVAQVMWIPLVILVFMLGIKWENESERPYVTEVNGNQVVCVKDKNDWNCETK